jgi:DNA-binding MarR family transcriptional regulator
MPRFTSYYIVNLRRHFNLNYIAELLVNAVMTTSWKPMSTKVVRTKVQRPVSALDAHVGYWVRIVSNYVAQAFRLKVETHGVTLAEWVILRQLFDSGDAFPSQIASSLGMTRGAITKLVDRLVAKGHLTRANVVSDRRYQSVALSASGRKLVPLIAKLADRNDKEFFGDLSGEQFAALKGILKRLVRLHQMKRTPMSQIRITQSIANGDG